MNDEIMLTAIAFIVCVAFIIRHSIPCLLEWLDAINIDDTTERGENHDK